MPGRRRHSLARVRKPPPHPPRGPARVRKPETFVPTAIERLTFYYFTLIPPSNLYLAVNFQ